MTLINCHECNKQISDKAEICIGCGAPVVLSYIIGKTISLPWKAIDKSTDRTGNLEIAERNFEELMSWNEAKKKCNEIGFGWRLPTKTELALIYVYRDEISGLREGDYWSSDELIDFPFQINFNKAYFVRFLYGENGHNIEWPDLKNMRYRVRAVRTSY